MARAGAASSIFPQSVIYSQPVATSPHIISGSVRFAIDIIVNLICPYSKSKCVYVKNQFICHEYIKILIFKSCNLFIFCVYDGSIYCRIGMTSLFPVDVTNFVKL